MAGSNIGKKPDHQYQRLGEHTQHFHKGHNGNGQFKPGRYTRCIEGMLPVIPVCTYIGNHEGKDRQDHCNGNIPCEVGTASGELE